MSCYHFHLGGYAFACFFFFYVCLFASSLATITLDRGDILDRFVFCDFLAEMATGDQGQRSRPSKGKKKTKNKTLFATSLEQIDTKRSNWCNFVPLIRLKKLDMRFTSLLPGDAKICTLFFFIFFILIFLQLNSSTWSLMLNVHVYLCSLFSMALLLMLYNMWKIENIMPTIRMESNIRYNSQSMMCFHSSSCFLC